MADPHAAFTALTISTWPKRMKDPVSQITQHIAFYKQLKKRGRIKTFDGGTQIEQPINLTENGTIMGFSGYEEFTMANSESLSQFVVPLKSSVMTVTEHGDNLRKNASAAKMISLVDNKIDVAKTTAKNHTSVSLHGDGTTKSSIWGLQYWLTLNGMGTVGGIPSADWPNWRNQHKIMAAANAWKNQIRVEFNEMWTKVEIDEQKPNLLLGTNDVFNAYEAIMQAQYRQDPSYMKRETAESSFESIMYKSAEFVRDQNANFAADGERCYFLNMDTWTFWQHKDAQYKPEPARIPVNQDAVVIPFFGMQNLMTDTRRLNGVMYDPS